MLVWTEGTQSEIITVFKRNNEVSSTHSKIAASFPKAPLKSTGVPGKVQYTVDHFYNRYGGMLEGKVFVGYFEYYSMGIYEYNISEDNWECVRGKESNKYSRYIRTGTMGCAVDDVYVLCSSFLRCIDDDGNSVVEVDNSVELLQFKNNVTNDATTANPPSASSINDKLGLGVSLPNLKQNLYTPMCFEQCICPTRQPTENSIFSHTLTRIGDNKVMLMGGKYRGTSSHSVFLGEITANKGNVTWKEMEPIKKARFSHMAFKMKESLYVVGGIATCNCNHWCNCSRATLSCCERYDLIEDKWYNYHHSLSYALESASAVVSLDETFAVITGGRDRDYKESSNVIIFTTERGFQELNNSSLLCPTHIYRQNLNHHLSVLLL